MEPRNMKLPQKLRNQFKKPWGNLLRDDDPSRTPEELAKELYQTEQPSILISVGDVCTESLWRVNVHPDIVIIDGITLRDDYKIQHSPQVKYDEKIVENAPATITKEAWITICETITQTMTRNSHVKITVKGEEDLLTLPAILCSPNNGVVTYGQPKEGIVWLKVTPELKEKVHRVLSQFEHL